MKTASNPSTNLAGETLVALVPRKQPATVAMVRRWRDEGRRGRGDGAARGASGRRDAHGRVRNLADESQLLGANYVVPQPGIIAHQHTVLSAVSVAWLAWGFKVIYVELKNNELMNAFDAYQLGYLMDSLIMHCYFLRFALSELHGLIL